MKGKRTMLLTLLGVIAALIAVVLIIAATKPDAFRVERETSIKAPPDRVFAYINDFHHWPAWSPWEKIDPALKRTYSGPTSGVGSLYAWEGNSKVGSGSMEIRESSPPGKVLIKLDFLKPFEAHNTAEFTMVPKGDTTDVTWAMYGPSPYFSKIMQTFMSMDKMVGGDFEKGLANLKAAAEQGAPK
jgi:uncharacterized protein YndB with AHSA1/START domain